MTLVLETNYGTPLLFRFDSRGKIMWGVRLDDNTDDAGFLRDQLRPLPTLSTGPSPAGVMVLDTWKVWRVEADGRRRWKRTGDRFDLDILTSMTVLDDQSVVIGGMRDLTPCNFSYASLARLDRKGERLWFRRYYFGRNWDFVVQILALADGRILGLVDPEGPAEFMGSASNACRDRSGQRNLIWLDRDGNRLRTFDLPLGASIRHLAELPDGRLAAIVEEWTTGRWSFRIMTPDGETVSQHSYGPADYDFWADPLSRVMDMRVTSDRIWLAADFNCSRETRCNNYSISRLFEMTPGGEILHAWNTGKTHVLSGSFTPDLEAFVGRSFDDQIIRIELD